MSHFAKLDDQNIVVSVTKGRQEDDGKELELSAMTGERYLQTSYNTRGGVHYQSDGLPSADQSKALRKNFASVGWTYDEVRDAFIAPCPSHLATLDEETCCWVLPTVEPFEG